MGEPELSNQESSIDSSDVERLKALCGVRKVGFNGEVFGCTASLSGNQYFINLNAVRSCRQGVCGRFPALTIIINVEGDTGNVVLASNNEISVHDFKTVSGIRAFLQGYCVMSS